MRIRELGNGRFGRLEIQAYRFVIGRRPHLDRNVAVRTVRLRLRQHHQHKSGQPVRTDRKSGQHAALHIEFVVHRCGGIGQERTRKYHAAEPTAPQVENMPRGSTGGSALGDKLFSATAYLVFYFVSADYILLLLSLPTTEFLA